MASKRLYIGNLSYNTDEAGLKDAFSGFGEVRDVKIIQDRETGRSRGFGFVEFSSESEAATAASTMNGADLDGRRLVVNEAEERSRGGGGGPRPSNGGGGGGYRSSGGPPPQQDFGSGGGGGGGGGGGKGGKKRGRDRDRDDRW